MLHRKLPASGLAGTSIEQIKPFAAHAVLETREACDIAARVGHTFDEASTNRVNNEHEHDRDSTGGLLQGRNHHAA